MSGESVLFPEEIDGRNVHDDRTGGPVGDDGAQLVARVVARAVSRQRAVLR